MEEAEEEKLMDAINNYRKYWEIKINPSQFKSNVRKLKLDIISGSVNVSYKTNDIIDMFYFLSKKGRIIKWLLDNNAILTGSKLLSISYINKDCLLNRSPKDFDFIVNDDILAKLESKFKFSISKDDRFIKVGNKGASSYTDYNGTIRYHGEHYVDLILDNNIYNKLFNSNSKIQIDKVYNVYKYKMDRNEYKDIEDLFNLYNIQNKKT